LARILLIEDDKTFSRIIQTFLTKKGYVVEACHDLKAGGEALAKDVFDLLLLDYRLPDGIGLDLITIDGKIVPPVPTIVITSFNDVRTAVKSMQSGIFEYIIKPVYPEELILVVEQALSQEKKEEPQPIQFPEEFIEGSSEVAMRLYEYVALVAPTDMSVMIMGESGTGKEHIARSIHELSKRSEKPFVPVDCGVLSKELAASELFGHVKGAFTGAMQDKKGLLESADGGTVFLDEIGNLGYDVQVKLLRMLQERTIQPVGSNKTIHVNIRLITATNEDLVSAISKGNFREDIYHRINEFKIQTPPLRERGEDLELFTDHFIRQANAELDRNVAGVSTEVMKIFHAYDWPGNLRELKNVVKRMVLLTPGKIADAVSLPGEMINSSKPLRMMQPVEDLKLNQEQTEKELITQALQKTKYNKSKAALLLNIDRKTLYAKMERYGID
jgi:two-component system, NtrC family, response regulator HydG